MTTSPHALPPAPGSTPPPASRPERPARPVSASACLQVAFVWRGQVIGYRLLPRRRRVTIGSSKRATFATPVVAGQPRFVLLAPRRGRKQDGYVLQLAEELRGEVILDGTTMNTTEIHSRQVDLARGDRARLWFADGSGARLEIRWVDRPDVLPRPRVQDPQLIQPMLGTSVVLGVIATVLTLIWHHEPPRPLAINPERLAKLQPPRPIEPPPEQIAKKDAAKAEEKQNEKQGQTKRAKERTGRLGRADATERDTVVPKGHDDVLREKVQKVGILSVLGRDKPAGSGLSKLFSQSNDVEQALAGMTGAKLAVGRGAGGLATAGAGTGGGGTGYGHIYGAGNLDTGGRGKSGHGRGPKLADRGEHEVSVAMGNGAGDSDGSLSKEQIMKVVRAHMAGVKYCYEKELQHKSTLAGGVDVFWVILPDGSVGKASIKGSTLTDPAVEGCILRQVKQWQFPKAPGQTIVGRFPFLFKGG